MRNAWIAAGLLAAASAAASADGTASPRERLLRDLGAEAVAARDDAARALAKTPDLTEDEVRAALGGATRLARPQLLRLAAARGMKGLAPEIVAALRDPDPVVTDAAARALVTLGDDAAGRGIESLRDATDPAAVAVRTHVEALALRRTIEHEIVGKWRRKGGTYEHRFDGLAKYGWPVQPILLAMLLDVPVDDRHIVLPATEDPLALDSARSAALEEIERSNRRGYCTFDPLPATIEPEELFDLAAQALKDVADLDLMGDILERVSARLQDVDESHGWRLRPWEEGFYREIDVVLFARGRPERLKNLAERCRERLETAVAWLARAREAGRDADQEQQISVALSEYASALHQLHRYDAAAACFAQVIRIGSKQGKEPAIAGYNRACALACAGRVDEALHQLDRSLDRDISTGAEDLTKEWVTEDGDLGRLRDDPRWAKLIEKHFGAADAPATGGSSTTPETGPAIEPVPLKPR